MEDAGEKYIFPAWVAIRVVVPAPCNWRLLFNVITIDESDSLTPINWPNERIFLAPCWKKLGSILEGRPSILEYDSVKNDFLLFVSILDALSYLD